MPIAALVVVVAFAGADVDEPRRIAIVALHAAPQVVNEVAAAVAATPDATLVHGSEVASALKDGPICANTDDDCWLKLALLNGFDVVLVVDSHDDVVEVRRVAKGSLAIARSGVDVRAVTSASLAGTEVSPVIGPTSSKGAPPEARATAAAAPASAPSPNTTLAWAGGIVAAVGGAGALVSGAGVAMFEGTLGDPRRAGPDKLFALDVEPWAIAGVGAGSVVAAVGGVLVVLGETREAAQ